MKKMLSLLALAVIVTSSAQLHAELIEPTSAEQFKQAVSGDVALVMIASNECSHCLQAMPKFRNAASSSGKKFVLVVTQKLNPGLVNLRVSSVPSYRLFKNGQQVATAGGELNSAAQIAAFANK